MLLNHSGFYCCRKRLFYRLRKTESFDVITIGYFTS